MSPTISRKALFQYSLLALPLAFAGLPLYIHMPDFYVRDFGLSLGVIGLILLLVRLFDALQDPLIGHYSDRYANKRPQILFVGLVLLTVGLFALFWGPQLSIQTALWFGLSMLLATSGFSIVVINLNMIGGFWSADTNQRTRIATWRESFTLIGLLIASLLPAILIELSSAKEAFKWASLVYLLLVILAGVLFWQRLRQIDLIQPTPAQSVGKHSLLQLLNDRQWGFFLTYLFVQIAAALPAVLVLFFIRDYLQAEQYTGLFLFLYFFAGSLLLPIWFFISKHIGKYHTWLLAMLLSILVFIWVLMLKPGDVWAYGIICVLSGFALGADLSLPASIVADRISAIKAEERATLYFGVMAFIPKLALALCSGIAFTILDQSNFVAGAVNTAESQQTLLLLYGLVPCLVKVLAVFSLWMLIRNKGEYDEFIAKRSNTNGLNDFS